MKHALLLLILLSSLAINAFASEVDSTYSAETIATVTPAVADDSIAVAADGKHKYAHLADSIWFNPVTGRRMHLQRLGGVDTLVVTRPDALKAAAKTLGINALILSYDHFVQDREWARVTSSVIGEHFRQKPVFDNDSFSGNQFSHPYHGGMFFNAARNEGLSYGVSLLYPLLGSASWEWLCETNPPSVNDLLSTGIGGAVIGEVSNRVSDIFYDDSTWGLNRIFRELFAGFLNPVRGVHRLLSGEMWRRSASRGKHIAPQPYSFEVGVGYRAMNELSYQCSSEHAAPLQHLSSPYLDFSFDYGERFNPSHRSKAFDLFSVSLLANLSSDHPSVGELEISGRLADRQFEHSHDWRLDVGFYQNLKYVDHYSKEEQHPHGFSIINEAVSFGGGLYAEHQTGKICFLNDCMLSAVVFGGTTADYYPSRRYNYASGLSLRNRTQFYINQRATIGNRFYGARLFSLHGYKPADVDQMIADGIEPNCWGDQGNYYIMTDNAFLQYNIWKNVRINIDYQIYLRRANYKYSPDVKARSEEWKIGLIYSI